MSITRAPFDLNFPSLSVGSFILLYYYQGCAAPYCASRSDLMLTLFSPCSCSRASPSAPPPSRRGGPPPCSTPTVILPPLPAQKPSILSLPPSAALTTCHFLAPFLRGRPLLAAIHRSTTALRPAGMFRHGWTCLLFASWIRRRARRRRAGHCARARNLRGAEGAWAHCRRRPKTPPRHGAAGVTHGALSIFRVTRTCKPPPAPFHWGASADATPLTVTLTVTLTGGRRPQGHPGRERGAGGGQGEARRRGQGQGRGASRPSACRE